MAKSKEQNSNLKNRLRLPDRHFHLCHLLFAFCLLNCFLLSAQAQGWTDASLSAINRTWQAPCGGSGTATQQIANSLASLTSYQGGTLDLDCYQQAVSITADVFSPVSVPVTVFLPAHTVTVNANATIPANFMICSISGGSIVAGVGFTLTNNAQSCFGSGAGEGTVTVVSAGNLAPLFTTSVALPTTTPALSFTLSDAPADSWFGNANSSSATPTFNTTTLPTSLFPTTIPSNTTGNAATATALAATGASGTFWGVQSGIQGYYAPLSTELGDYGSVTGGLFGSQTANCFFGAPNGSSGNMSCRGILASDLPVTSLVTLPTANMLWEYQMLPTENPCALVDYSGAGNSVTACVGTAPTIISGTGGVNFVGTGALTMPAAANSALTYIFYATFEQPDLGPLPTSLALIQGTVTGHAIGFQMYATNVSNSFAVAQNQGGLYHMTSLYQSTLGDSSYAITNGTHCFAMVLGATDLFYVDGIAVNYLASTYSSAGAQTSGNFQLGGGAAGSGQAVQSYFYGEEYFSVGYSTAFSQALVGEACSAITTAMTARGVPLQNNLGPTFQIPQLLLYGDSITANFAGSANYVNFYFPPTGVMDTYGQSWTLENQGESGYPIEPASAQNLLDTLPSYAGGAATNVAFYDMGSNSLNNATNTANNQSYQVQYGQQMRNAGFKLCVSTVLDRGSDSLAAENASTFTRGKWHDYADCLFDWAANPNLGANGANTNTTYFQSDKIHPTTLSSEYIIAPMISKLAAFVSGPKDYSSAYTANYVSGPTIGVATNPSSSLSSTTPLLSTTFSAGVVSQGSCLVSVNSGGGGNASVTGVWDTHGNTWTQVGSTLFHGNAWYTTNSTPGQLNIGYTASTTLNNVEMNIVEIKDCSGLETSSQGTTVDAGTSFTGGSVTPTENGDMVIGLLSMDGGTGLAVTSPFTAANCPNSGGSTVCTMYYVQPTAGAIAPNVTTTASAYGAVLTLVFKHYTPGVYNMEFYDRYLNVNPSGGSMTVVLPEGDGLTGQGYHILNTQTTGSNTVTVVPQPTAITSASWNGTTATYTVSNTYWLYPNQTVVISGCTTSGLNGTFTVASVPSTTTFTVANITSSGSESEPTGAQFINEFINGASSYVIPNGGSINFQNMFLGVTTSGSTWITAP